MNKVAVYLNRQLHGNVFDKRTIREHYATDRSVLHILPRLVALPENSSDIKKLCRFVYQLASRGYRLPIAVRGSGLDTTGADLTPGIVLSTERLNAIKEIDAHDRLVHVEAGVTIGELNAALASHGLIIPISVDPRETIGGLISNCPTDSYAGKYGGLTNYVDRIEVVLANGEVIQTSRLGARALARKKSAKSVEATLYKNLERLLEDNEETLDSIRGIRSSAGYPYSQYIIRENGKIFDMLPAFYGAEGTLGVITEAILRAEPIPHHPEHLLVSFSTFRAANEFLSEVKRLCPLELEIFDMTVIRAAEQAGNKPPVLTRSVSEGYLVYLSFAERPHINRSKIEKTISFLPKSAKIIRETKENTSEFGTIFNALASYLNDDVRGERTPFVSDFYVPADELPGFISNISALEDKYKIKIPLYGSYSTSIYSVRPDLQLTTDSGRRFLVEFLTDFNKLLKYHYGYLCGGTPEGRLKALLTNHEFTASEKRFYQDLKKLFDPANILAPDIKLGADPRSTSRHFRTELSESISI